jgi:hypothetical protein
MERKYYSLEEVTQTSEYSVEDLIYWGSHEKIGIGVIIGNGIALRQVIDKRTGAIIEENMGAHPGHTVKLDPYCIQNLEAGQKSAEVILCKYYGKPEDNIEVIKVLNIDTGEPLLIKDCKLIIYADDLERFKQSQLSVKIELTDQAKASPRTDEKPAQQNKHRVLNDWEIPDPRDTPPKYDWYTPARYFARKFVAETPSFLSKKNLLRVKISRALFDVNIKSIYQEALNPESIKKALVYFDYSLKEPSEP